MNRYTSTLFVCCFLISGCSQPSGLIGNPYPDEPTPYAPEGVVEPRPQVSDNEEPSVPGWFVHPRDSNPVLPRTDAILNLTIEVDGVGSGDSLDAFQGGGWIFRLSLLNGTIEADPEADWFRSYTLKGTINATTLHETSFAIGDIIAGDPKLTGHPTYRGPTLVLGLNFHKIYQTGGTPWEAHQCTLLYHDEGTQFVSSGRPKCTKACVPIEPPESSPCPWYTEHGLGSPPPAIW